MQLAVNGQMQESNDDITLLEYLQGNGIDMNAVVVEHNRSVVKADDFGTTVLNDGDVLEILQFVGGG